MSATATALPRVPASVQTLQREMLRMPQQPMETRHDFAPGLYIRTLTIPADTLLIGAYHAAENIFILSKGSLLLYTPDGSSKRIDAPYQVVAQPGKKVGYAITECVTHNVHISDETDLVLLEKECIVPEELLLEGAPKCLGA